MDPFESYTLATEVDKELYDWAMAESAYCGVIPGEYIAWLIEGDKRRTLREGRL